MISFIGEVANFNVHDFFGFIRSASFKTDVFFESSGVRVMQVDAMTRPLSTGAPKTLLVGQKVKFEVLTHPRLKAVNIVALDDGP